MRIADDDDRRALLCRAIEPFVQIVSEALEQRKGEQTIERLRVTRSTSDCGAAISSIASVSAVFPLPAAPEMISVCAPASRTFAYAARNSVNSDSRPMSRGMTGLREDLLLFLPARARVARTHVQSKARANDIEARLHRASSLPFVDSRWVA